MHLKNFSVTWWQFFDVKPKFLWCQLQIWYTTWLDIWLWGAVIKLQSVKLSGIFFKDSANASFSQNISQSNLLAQDIQQQLSNVSGICIFSVRNCQINLSVVVFIFREDPQSRLSKPGVTSSPYKTPEEPLPVQEERAEPQEEEPPPRRNMILCISLIVW